MIDNEFPLSYIRLDSFEDVYLYVFNLLRIYKFSCDLYLAILGLMGRLADSQFILLVESLIFNQYLTLFIRIYYITDDG